MNKYYKKVRYSKKFEMYDFELIDAIPQNTHGGSIRYVISRRTRAGYIKKISKLLKYEDTKNISNLDGCIEFKKNCEISELQDYLFLKLNSF